METTQHKQLEPPNCLLNNYKPNLRDVQQSFIRGCRGKCFDRIIDKTQFKECAIIGLVGNQVKMFDICENFWYMDNSYFLRGSKYYRIVRNGLYSDGIGNNCDKKFNSYNIKLQKWRTGGKKITLVPPSKYVSQILYTHNWLENTTQELRKYTDREILISTKANPVNFNDDIWCIVTCNSNIQIDALVVGVPVITTHFTKIGSLDMVEFPPGEESRNVLYNLAQEQWTVNEMRSGKAWRDLLELQKIKGW